MPSGHGTNKPDTAGHPARVVAKENWRGTGIWDVSSPLGKLHTVASDPDEYGEHGLTAWQTEKGYVGQVEHHEPVSGGWQEHTHQTPAFRTPLRAQIGAESLSRRITKRDADMYKTGEQHLSYEDMMPEGASMRRR